eukprot:6424738-Pyramimonas_sp.AAC.1
MAKAFPSGQLAGLQLPGPDWQAVQDMAAAVDTTSELDAAFCGWLGRYEDELLHHFGCEQPERYRGRSDGIRLVYSTLQMHCRGQAKGRGAADPSEGHW